MLPPMSYIAERRQEERARRREEIVDAAESLYAETGWDSVTMDKVARRARLSRALLYVYFKDKGDLHLAIVERALETLRERMDVAAASHALGIEKLEAVGRAYIRLSEDLPHYFDACLRFQADSAEHTETDERSCACSSAGLRVHETVVAALRRGVEDGSIRSGLPDLDATAVTAWAFMHGVIQIISTKAGQIEHQGTTVGAVTDQAFALFRRALQPGSELDG